MHCPSCTHGARLKRRKYQLQGACAWGITIAKPGHGGRWWDQCTCQRGQRPLWCEMWKWAATWNGSAASPVASAALLSSGSRQPSPATAAAPHVILTS